ncbi:MAG: T9SS type A sorting domain-containing protein [Candidatus Marinimicrobia bacterium]|jgi:pectate lyase|nr:T9SS type A sorting domain-containing protein [Candidatus Neomarinimicrobiota bacterium]
MPIFIIVSLIGIFAANLPAQTAASATWPLTADQNAVVSGNITALPQTLQNMQVYYSSSVQRSSPSGTAGEWPGENEENSYRYMQFAVTPDEGFIFFATGIAMYLYVNSGSNMRANVYYSTDPFFATKTQIGATFTLSSSAPSTPNVTADLNQEVSYGDTLYVRIYPWYTTSTTGKYIIANSVVISGSTMPSTCILVSPTALSRFVQEDTASPSTTQIYYLSGMNLTDNVVVFPPPDFEISVVYSSSWIANGDSLCLPVTDGDIVGQPLTIAVRLSAGTPGEYSGAIVHSSAGAAGAVVNVSGVLLAAEPTIASTVSLDSVSGKTATLSFTGGNGAKRIVAICSGTETSWLPEDGIAINGVSENFSEAIDQGNGTKVVYDGEGSSVTITGLSSNTTYSVAVFEYNVANGNTHNYLSTHFGSATFSTAIVPVLDVSPTALNFGSVIIEQERTKSYSLTGNYLLENNLIDVSAPPGFEVSLSPDGGFTSLLQIAYTAPNVDTTIFVRFTPFENKVYSGLITNTDGSDTVNVAVTGKGVYTLVQTAEPVGFATLNGGTTGGVGGDSVVVTTPEQLYELMYARENKSTAPLVVQVSGILSGYSSKISVKRTGNISIIGLGSDAGLNGFGIKIVECSNIIIRNLTFADCHVDEKDALELDECQNVWVDHCTFTDSPANDPNGSNHDGLLDIKNGSRNITVSYNYFTNHRQTCLLGHTKSQITDTVMTVTYYRNWFDGTYSRHPRIRFAKAHIVNNLYTDIQSYGVGVTCEAQVFVEANYFENTPVPVLISQVNDPGETLSGDPVGYIRSLDNFTVSSGEIVENLTGYHFDPNAYYSYEAVPSSMVKTLVMENAGAGVLDTTVHVAFKTNASIPVKFLLMQNYPNPFNPTTTISFQTPQDGKVTLKVYDLLGRDVATIFEGAKPAGKYFFIFNAGHLPGGIYFYRIEAGNFRQIRKMTFLK